MSAGVDHQLGDLGDPADVLHPVGVGEAEILVEAVADVVAVQQVGVPAGAVQLLVDQVGDGRLAGPGEPREPEHAGRWRFIADARRLVDVERLPVDVLGAAQGEAQHPGADRVVGDAIDEDEPAGVAVHLVRIEGDRRDRARQLADADLVELERRGRQCSRLLTLILYLRDVTVAVTVRVPILRR